ncbi:MAG TPA: MFS transporter [Pseudogracilibacillus sp.]|nr:MFS transporter [Pseudogracilibacillus sp.]
MKENKNEKIWTKNFISISIIQFLVFTVFYSLMTTLPVYAIQQLNLTQANAGLVVSAMLVSAILMRPFSAKIIDLLGKKRGLVFSIILYTITTISYLFFDQFVPLLVIRFIHGFSFAIITTVTGAIAADVIPRSRRGAGMGYFAMSMNLAIVVGPFVGLSVLQFGSFQILLALLSTLMIISVIFSTIIRLPDSVNSRDHGPVTLQLKLSDLIEVKALSIALISGLVGFVYASILSFISVYAESIGLLSTASYFFLVFAVVMIAFRPFLGRAFDNRGPRIVLVPSLIIFSLGLILLSFTNTAALLLISAGLVGLGYGTLLPGFQTIAIQAADKDRSSHAISTFFIFYDTGIAAGSYIWGIIVAKFGFENMYFISAVIILITAYILNQYLKHK